MIQEVSKRKLAFYVYARLTYVGQAAVVPPSAVALTAFIRQPPLDPLLKKEGKPIIPLYQDGVFRRNSLGGLLRSNLNLCHAERSRSMRIESIMKKKSKSEIARLTYVGQAAVVHRSVDSLAMTAGCGLRLIQFACD